MSNYSCTAPEACQRSTGRRFPNSTPESQETCFRPNHTCSSSSCHLLSSEHDAQGDHKYIWQSLVSWAISSVNQLGSHCVITWLPSSPFPNKPDSCKVFWFCRPIRRSAQVDCQGVRQDAVDSDTAYIRCIRKFGRLLAGVVGETSMDALVLTSLNLQENVLEEHLL